MSLPDVVCRIGFASTPGESLASTSWTDVSDYVLAFDTSRGKTHELERMQAGTCRVQLDNQDRRFDPSNASSPYYPNILPMRRLQLRATNASGTYDIFTGYVEDWGQTWELNGKRAVCEVSATDAFKSTRGSSFAKPYQTIMSELSPTMWWKLDETSGLTAADSGASGITGTHSAASAMTVGSAAIIKEGYSVTYASGGGSNPIAYTTAASHAAFNVGSISWAWAGWFTPNHLPTSSAQIWLGRNSTKPNFAIGLLDPTGFSTQSLSAVVHIGDFGQIRATSATGAIAAGGEYFVVAQRAVDRLELYINGEIAASTPLAGPIVGDTSTVTLGKSSASSFVVGGNPPNGIASNASAAVDELAFFYERSLTAAEVKDLYVAGTHQRVFTSSYSGTILSQVLDSVDYPGTGLMSGNDRDIDTGKSTLQSFTPTNATMLETAQRIAETEYGEIFVAKGGKFTFRDRHDRILETSSSATFGDGGGSELPYADLGVSYDDSEIYNDIRITREGGTEQRSYDQASIDAYLGRTLNRDNTLHATDNDARAQADFLRGRYSQPRLRIHSMKLVPEAAPSSLWPKALGLELGQRITIKRRPPGTGTLTQDSYIESIAHSYSASPKQWTTNMGVSAAENYEYWVLGDSVRSLLGTSTRLGY